MSAHRDQLKALYAEVDQALQGWTCDDSTDCCHFTRTGREPYVWPIEYELVDQAIAARGGRRAPMLVVLEEDGACPLLGPDNRCTIYAARPFGCRTFFCDRACGPARRPPRDALAAIGKRIAALAQKVEPTCEGPRPLSAWLEARGRRRR